MPRVVDIYARLNAASASWQARGFKLPCLRVIALLLAARLGSAQKTTLPKAKRSGCVRTDAGGGHRSGALTRSASV